MYEPPPIDACATVWCYVSAFFQSNFFTTLIAGGIGAIGGSFAGAYFAFRWSKIRDTEKQFDEEFSAGKKAQYNLIRQYEFLVTIDEQYLGLLRSEPHPEVIAILMEGDHHFPKIDIDSLFFILNTKNPELLHEIDIQNRRFWSFIEILSNRNNLISVVQDAVTKGKISAMDFVRLKNLTEGLLDSHKVAFGEATIMFDKLSDFLKGNYENRTILQMGAKNSRKTPAASDD